MSQAIRVLLIEDDLVDAKTVERALRKGKTSFEITHSVTLQEARAALASKRFDVALLDLSLPDSQHPEGFQAVRKMAPELPLLILTGHDDEELARVLVAGGVQDYLIKGQESGRSLIRNIRHAIERQSLRRQLEQANDELARSNKDLEEFGSVISHDLQDPLHTVSTFLKLLENRCSGQIDEEVDSFIRFAVEGTAKMQKLVEGLLEYARIGRQSQALEPVSCEAVLDDVLRNLEYAITDAGARIEHDALPAVKGDPVQLHQLFQNLIGNALKFRGEQRLIVEIKAQKRGHLWQMSVNDNGIGIAVEDQQRIFMIFERLHTNSPTKGSGIGLAIVKRVVERHGGDIKVESTPGQGTSFRFTLPAASEQEA